jgi:hypothetical protein
MSTDGSAERIADQCTDAMVRMHAKTVDDRRTGMVEMHSKTVDDRRTGMVEMHSKTVDAFTSLLASPSGKSGPSVAPAPIFRGPDPEFGFPRNAVSKRICAECVKAWLEERTSCERQDHKRHMKEGPGQVAGATGGDPDYLPDPPFGYPPIANSNWICSQCVAYWLNDGKSCARQEHARYMEEGLRQARGPRN